MADPASGYTQLAHLLLSAKTTPSFHRKLTLSTIGWSLSLLFIGGLVTLVVVPALESGGGMGTARRIAVGWRQSARIFTLCHQTLRRMTCRS